MQSVLFSSKNSTYFLTDPTDSKTFWNVFKPYLTNKSVTGNHIILNEDGESIKAIQKNTTIIDKYLNLKKNPVEKA